MNEQQSGEPTNIVKVRAANSNPNRINLAVYTRTDTNNPLKQMISFEKNKNGTVAMYATGLWTMPLDRYQIKERPIFLKVLADSKTNTKGMVQNSTWSLYAMMANFANWLRPKADNADVIMPFNSAMVTGHITSTLVPTYSLNKQHYGMFMKHAMEYYNAIAKEPVGSQTSVGLIAKLMELQDKYTAIALKSGGLQESQVLYVERDGFMPMLSLHKGMHSASNKLLNIDTYLKAEHTNLPISFPSHTNTCAAYVVVDMGTQSGESSNGKLLKYGVNDLPSDTGGTRKRFMREGIMSDGQGNEQRITIELVNASYGDGGRAQAIEDILKLNNHIVVYGQLTAYAMYGDRESMANKFSITIDQWWVNNQVNQSTIVDNGFTVETDMFAITQEVKYEPVLDDLGNPMLNEDGTPMMKEVVTPQSDEAINALLNTDLSAIIGADKRPRAPVAPAVNPPIPAFPGIDDINYNTGEDDDLPF